MGHEQPPQSDQLSFFPEDEEFKKVMGEIRKEEVEKSGIDLPSNDESLKMRADLRIADRKTPSHESKPLDPMLR